MARHGTLEHTLLLRSNRDTHTQQTDRQTDGMNSCLCPYTAVCSSMCLVCNGEIDSLAAIYSIAFLLVMCLFAGAGLYLKISRPNLQRPQRSCQPHTERDGPYVCDV